jgi:hypothetical protein
MLSTVLPQVVLDIIYGITAASAGFGLAALAHKGRGRRRDRS